MDNWPWCGTSTPCWGSWLLDLRTYVKEMMQLSNTCIKAKIENTLKIHCLRGFLLTYIFLCCNPWKLCGFRFPWGWCVRNCLKNYLSTCLLVLFETMRWSKNYVDTAYLLIAYFWLCVKGFNNQFQIPHQVLTPVYAPFFNLSF